MRVIKVSFSISVYENHPSRSSREMPNLISLHCPTKSHTNWVHVWVCVKCLMSQWHQPKMLPNQDLAEYITRRASTGTCVSSYLAKPLPWQIKKKKNLTGTLANSNLHQAPFWFLRELEFPLFFITHHLCSRCTHAIIFYKKKEQLNQFSKRHYPEPRPIFRPLATEFWLLQFPICK